MMLDNTGWKSRRGGIAIWVALGVALLACGVLAFWLGWPKYRSWRAARAMAEARQAYLVGEYRRQQLHLEQALQIDPDNMDARRQLARFNDMVDPLRARVLWDGLCLSEPMNLENHEGRVLSLVRSGLAPAALEALDSVPESLRRQASYHRMAGAAAMAAGRLDLLQSHMDALASSGISDTSLSFGRVALRMLVARTAAEYEAAVTELVAYARQDGFRIRGTLALLRVQPAGIDRDRWIGQVSGLLLSRSAPASPRSGQLWGLVEYMASQPDPGPEDAVEFVRWLREQGLVQDAIQWLRKTPASLLAHGPVAEAYAACLVQVGDWRTLRTLLEKGVWGVVNSDCLELAYASRQQREMSKLSNAKATWQDALDAAEKSPVSYRVLQRLAGEWGWIDEREMALRRLLRIIPADVQAWSVLFQLKCRQAQTDEAWLVLLEWQRRQPGNAALQADQLLFGALVGRLTPAQESRVFELASEPSASVSVLVAKAYLLNLKGRTAESGEVIGALKRRDAKGVMTPRARLALAVVQKASGHPDEVKLLVSGLSDDSFFPEEKALLAALKRDA